MICSAASILCLPNIFKKFFLLQLTLAGVEANVEDMESASCLYPLLPQHFFKVFFLL